MRGNKIKSLTGTEVISGKGNDEITWKVIVSCDLDDFANNTKNKANLKGNQFDLLGNLGESILNFWCGDIWQQLEKMNEKIEERINKPSKLIHECALKLVTKSELITFIALVIGATNESVRGRNLWGKDNRRTLSKHTDYTNYMCRTRFHEIKGVVHIMMEDESVQGTDDWWKARAFIDGFNKKS